MVPEGRIHYFEGAIASMKGNKILYISLFPLRFLGSPVPGGGT
jgi:hypothetical protein